MSNGKSTDKTRVQFDFTPDAYKELTDLQDEVNAATKAEAVRYALRTLQWLMGEIKAGKKILVSDDGNVQEVVFPFLTRRDRESVKPTANLPHER